MKEKRSELMDVLLRLPRTGSDVGIQLEMNNIGTSAHIIIIIITPPGVILLY